MTSKWILAVIFCVLTISTNIADSICCDRIEELVQKKKKAFATLCASGNNLPQGCCDDIKKEVKSFEDAYQSLCVNSSNILGNSSILKNKPQWITQLQKWLPSNLRGHKTVLCYRATVNGWRSNKFHSRCDSKGPTLVIIKKGSYVFGGFASQSWGGSGRYIRAPNSFIFSFKNKDGLKPFKSTIYRYQQYAMYTNTYYGPTFGGGHDIYIANNAGSYSNSYTNFGYVYKLPSGYSYGSTKARNLLAGSYRFSPNEVEVFYFSAPILQDSSIIKNKKWVEKLEEWLPSNLHGKLTERCYKASVNGWSGSTFHRRCDSKGPTLVIIKSGSYVFGGFASQSWGGNTRYIRAANSFIFSFKNKDGLAPFKSNTSNNAYAMYTSGYYGPTFGYGFDIYIANNAGSSSSSYTNFGYGYKLPSGYSAGNSKTRNLLPGSYRFTPNELEVYYFSTPILQDSSILKDKKKWIEKLQQWLPSYLNDKKTVRCYQATKNGWGARTFHSRCDSKGPTLVIIKKGSYVFGAFASESWGGGRSGYIQAPENFIFSFKNKDNLAPFKSNVTRYKQYSMYTYSSYGPTFGGGHDIYIANNAGSYSNSYTNFGYTYKLPSGYSYGSTKAKNLLAGSYKFIPNEVEAFYFSPLILQDSVILKTKQEWIGKLQEWLPSNLNGKKTKRCYKATSNGWRASTFHSCCDSKGPTLVVVKYGDCIFGGFASKSWGGSSRYIRASDSFIFSLKNPTGLAPFKSSIYRYQQYAMYTSSSYGPTFGGGHDLKIGNNARTSTSSYTNFGHTYKLPSGYSYASNKAKKLLGGSYQFRPNEIEVFYFSS